MPDDHRSPLALNRFVRGAPLAFERPELVLDPGRMVGPIIAGPWPVDLLRAQDLLSLRCSFENLKWGDTPEGDPPVLVRRVASRPAYLIVSFQGQHIIEQAFFQSAGIVLAGRPPPPAPADPDASPRPPDNGLNPSPNPLPPPVFASLAGNSRLVFRVTDHVITYTTRGILDAISRLELVVAPQAIPPVSQLVRPWQDVVEVGNVKLASLGAGSRGARRRGSDVAREAALVSNALAFARATRAAATLEHRFGVESATRAVVAGRIGERIGIGKVIEPERKFRRKPPLPSDPAGTETAIELPWRLIVSPNRTAAWAHSPEVVERNGRTELWHSRLGSRGTAADEAKTPIVIETRMPDRTIRAIWARDFDELGRPLTPKPQTGDFPFADGTQDQPRVRTSLNSRDRMMLVHETANFHLQRSNGADWTPPAVPVDQLMLSTLGGWLESRLQVPTLPNVDVTIEEWKHLAGMGRDHEVKVVYAGYLLPFGHRASLVKVTERKIHNGPQGRVAYAFQRMFIIVREPEKQFTAATVLPGGSRADLAMPLKSVRIVTRVTPDLDLPVSLPGGSGLLFVPRVGGPPFPFKVVAVDRESNVVEFRAPLTFMERDRNSGKPGDANTSPLKLSLDQYNNLGPADRRMPLNGQKLAYADSDLPDDTSLVTDGLTFDALPLPGATSSSGPGDNAKFLPVLNTADAVVPAMSALAGAASPVALVYPDAYRKRGFTDNAAQVFFELADPAKLEFAGQGDRSGGFVTPSIDVTGLSRLTGPVGGDLADLIGSASSAAQFDPKKFFAGVNAKLFGIVPLTDLLPKIPFDPSKMPTFVAKSLDLAATLADNARQLRAAVEQVEAQAGATATQLRTALTTFATDFGQLVTNPGSPPDIAADLTAIKTRLAPFLAVVEGLTSLPRSQLEQTLAAGRRLEDQLSDVTAAATLLQQLARGELLPEVVSARLDWSTAIPAFPTGAGAGDAILWPIGSAGGAPNTAKLSLAVDLQAPTRPGREPTVLVSCSITPLDIRLIGASTFLILHFETLEFSIVPGKKPDVNVRLRDDDGVEFAGPLTFVNTLRSVIPFDGFSDPPYLDVTAEGIAAGFDLSIPNLSVGLFSLENISLGAAFRVPFVADSLEVSFNFCTRENPFRLSVMIFAGGGFFGVTLTPSGVRVLEVALEFGAAVSINFGVASGGLSAIAGIYFKIEIAASGEECVLSGYFRLRGEVDVLGLISASIELYLSLTYETATKSAAGRATLTIEVEVMFFSASVDISCEKKFAGSDQDPGFIDQMGPRIPVGGQPRPWDVYCHAFAD